MFDFLQGKFIESEKTREKKKKRLCSPNSKVPSQIVWPLIASNRANKNRNFSAWLSLLWDIKPKKILHKNRSRLNIKYFRRMLFDPFVVFSRKDPFVHCFCLGRFCFQFASQNVFLNKKIFTKATRMSRKGEQETSWRT